MTGDLQPFFLPDGHAIETPGDLLHLLPSMSTEQFRHHVNENKNDFTTWIRESCSLPGLAHALEGAATPEEMVQEWEAYITPQETPVQKKRLSIEWKQWLPYGIMFLLLLLLIAQSIGYQKTISELESGLEELQEGQDRLQTRVGQLQIRQDEPIVEQATTRINLYDFPEAAIAPFPRIEEEQIRITEDRVELYLTDVQAAAFADSDSMLPTLSTGAYGLQITPDNPDLIHEGDIIAYETGEQIIIHRVVEVGKDEEGWYAITRGDNNASPDAEPVRFNQVIGLLVGIIY